MALTAPQRAATALAFVQEAFVDRNATAVLNSTDVRSAVNAADDWLETNLAAMRAALPAAARTALSTAQQETLLCWVLMKRAGII